MFVGKPLGYELLTYCLTENELNNLISNTNDMKILHAALEFKLDLINKQKSGTFDFDIDYILQFVDLDKSDQDFNTDILKNALLVQKSDAQYKRFILFLSDFLLYDQSLNSDLVLKLLSVINMYFDLINIKYGQGFRDLQAKNEEIIGNILTENINCTNKRITNLLYFSLLPQFLNLCATKNKHYYLHKIFIKKNIDALCALSDFFVSLDFCDNFSFLYYDDYWHLLQEYIISNCNLKQKQGLFLMRNSINVFEKNWNSVSESELPLVIKLNTSNKMEFLDSWKNYLILLEIAREEHYHLIEPSLSLLQVLHLFHPLWIISIYRVLLSHPNNLITHKALQNLFTTPCFNKISIFKDSIEFILPVLARSSNYDILNATYSSVNKFLSVCEDDIHSLIFEKSVSLSWSPNSLWHFYKCLLSQEKALINLDTIENGFAHVKTLPHVYIRNGCKTMLIKYLLKFMEQSGDPLENYLKLFKYFINKDETIMNNLSEMINKEIVVRLIKNNIGPFTDTSEIELIIFLGAYHKIDIYELSSHFQQLKIYKSLNLKLVDGLFFNTYNFYQNRIKFLYSYIMYRLETCFETIYIEAVTKKLIAKLMLSSNVEIYNNYMTSLIEKASEILLQEENKHSEIQKQLAFYIVIEAKEVSLMKQICKIWIRNMIDNYKKCDANTCLSFLDLYVLYTFGSNENLPRDIFIQANCIFLSLMEYQHHEIFPELIEKLLSYIIRNTKTSNFKLVKNTISKCIREILLMTKSSMFKKFTDNFIKAVFIETFLQIEEANDCIQEICNVMYQLTKKHSFIALALIKQLKMVVHANSLALKNIIPLILDLMLFNKNSYTLTYRNEYEVCEEIFEKCRLKGNPNAHDLNIHFGTIEIMLAMINDDSLPVNIKKEIVNSFTDGLGQKYLSNFYKKRYFPNSEAHIFKQKIVQVLLILQPYLLYSKEKKLVVNLILNSLHEENHQQSVKHLMQWLLVKLFQNDESEMSVLRDKVATYCTTESNVLIIILPVIYHLADNYSEEQMLELFEILIPTTMGAQFKLRLYSQLLIKKLYDIANSKNYIKITKQYQFLNVSIKTLMCNSKEKADEVLRSDKEFLTEFLPNEHYALETIYVDFPKLDNVDPMYWQNFKYIKFFKHIQIAIFNNCKRFSDVVQNRIKHDATNEQDLKVSNKNIYYFQKKIETWNVFETEKTSQTINFILIASLIEKPANVGGLSRTCEVFGLRKLVVENIKALQEKAFSNLSMTSEKWMHIDEVNKCKLKDYLLEMKKEGFEIVAAEQTSGSVSLAKHNFKKKTVLLLGNEKEGIAPNFLMLADVCVEIPQMGIIRSLNVHVAGAMIMWEYIKQHNL